MAGLSRAAKACLGAGLAGTAAAALDAPAEDWRDVIREGLAPTALKLLGRDDVTCQIYDAMIRVTMLQQARSLAADALLERLVDLFDPVGIRFVVIKGPAVSRLYPSPWPRPYSDIDLLVEPRQFGAAMDLCVQHGFKYPDTSLPPWPWFDALCREGLNLHGAGNVDLHHHVAPWVFGQRLRAGDVIGQADHVTVGGKTVAVASAEHSAVIAALHILNDLWKGRRGLVSWRDFLLIVSRFGVDRVREGFEQSDLGWLFDLLVSSIAIHLPDVLEGVDGEPAGIPSRFSWRMRGLGWGRSTSISRQRLAWAIRLPLPQAAAFVMGSGLPSRRYIKIRHGSYWGYWRQAWTETVSTFSGADHRSDKQAAKGVEEGGEA